MKKISVYVAVSLMIISGVLGVGVGFWLTPEYSLSMYDKSSMGLGNPDRWLDLRYIDTMIAHHTGAMLLAEQGAANGRDDIKNMSSKIIAGEKVAIAELYGWKKEWYGSSKKVADPVVENLGEAGEKFDLRFLNALIAHHERGVMMAEEAKTKSSRREVVDNAYAVEAFLANGVVSLKELRNSWYGV